MIQYDLSTSVTGILPLFLHTILQSGSKEWATDLRRETLKRQYDGGHQVVIH
eukprot:c35745_g1_i1 orf=1-153(-)